MGLLALLGVGVVVVAALAMSRSGQPRSQDPGDTTAPSLTPTTTAPPPPAGSVRLVEKGFSIGTSGLEENNVGPLAHAGFIVENTSDQIAISTPITYHYVDSAGNVLESDYADVELGALGPGQRFAWGDFDRLPMRPGPPTEVIVEVGEPRQWLAPGSLASEADQPLPAGSVSLRDLEELAAATVDDVTVSYDGSDLNVAFTVSSDAGEEVHGTAGLILRNRSGQIVIGWVSPADLRPGATAFEVQIPTEVAEPGDRGRLAGIDPAQTEIYFAGL